MSIGLTILCVGLAFRFFVRGGNLEMMLGVGMLAITFGCALFTIRGYTITRNALLVHRLLWNTRLSLEGLKSAQFELGAMRWGIRCGNGGFFSFTGLFYNHKLGFHRAFVTDHIRTVVLRFAKRTVVVSPADPEVFVRDLAACRSRREEAQTEIGKQKTEMGQSVVSPAAQKEKLFIGLATVFFIVMIPTLLGIALAYPRQDTAPILVMAMCVAGLVVCGLRLAGLWPFSASRFPEPNFSSRNLSRPPGSSRREEAQTEKPESGKRKAEIEPRFSRTAIVGACMGLPFVLSVMVLAFTALSGRQTQSSALVNLVWGCIVLLLFCLGCPRRLATTILGWIAVSQIRRSAGKLHGLWLAVFDGLFFPLLVVDGAIAWLWLVLAKLFARQVLGLQDSLFLDLWDHDNLGFTGARLGCAGGLAHHPPRLARGEQSSGGDKSHYVSVGSPPSGIEEARAVAVGNIPATHKSPWSDHQLDGHDSFNHLGDDAHTGLFRLSAEQPVLPLFQFGVHDLCGSGFGRNVFPRQAGELARLVGIQKNIQRLDVFCFCSQLDRFGG